MIQEKRTHNWFFVIILILIAAGIGFNGYLNSQRYMMEKEVFVGDLMYQYYADLGSCVDITEMTPEKCSSELEGSNLVKLINKYGGEKYIK